MNFTDPLGEFYLTCQLLATCTSSEPPPTQGGLDDGTPVINQCTQEAGSGGGCGWHNGPPASPRPASKVKTPAPSPDKSHQCLAKAGGNFALHAGVDALGFIPGVGGAAVATFSGYAVTLIDSNTPEGPTATSVGLNALGTVDLVAKANEASIAEFSARLAEGIPGIGTAITLGSIALDGYNAVKQYQACMAGGN